MKDGIEEASVRQPNSGLVVTTQTQSVTELGGTTGRRRRPHPDPIVLFNNPRYADKILARIKFRFIDESIALG